MTPSRDRRAILLITSAIFLQVFLAALDTNIVSTAMPTVVATLGGMQIYSWVFTAYLISSTLAIPIAGKLSDQLSRKRLYLISIAGFLVTSALCGLSTSMMWLIVCRAFQGMAGGTMFAISLGLLGALYPPAQRGKVQSYVSSLWAIASVVGPPLGGFVVENFSWRWAFYLNIPLGLIAIFFITRFLHEEARETKTHEIDYLGAALLSFIVLGAMVAITNIEKLSGWTVAAIALAVAGLTVVLLRVERRAAEPILPLALLKQKEIAAANLATLTTAIGVFGLIIFAPLFVQGVLLGTASEAGIVLLPVSLGWASGSIVSGRLMNHFGYRSMTVLGALSMLAGFCLQIIIAAATSIPTLSVVCFLAGLGMGFVTNSITVAVQNNVPEKDIGVATASTVFSRAFGAATGASVLGVILSLSVKYELRDNPKLANGEVMAEVRSLLLPETRLELPPELMAELKNGLANGLHLVFLTCAGVALLSVFIAWHVSRGRPQES